jgi:hypothetical protein
MTSPPPTTPTTTATNTDSDASSHLRRYQCCAPSDASSKAAPVGIQSIIGS